MAEPALKVWNSSYFKALEL